MTLHEENEYKLGSFAGITTWEFTNANHGYHYFVKDSVIVSYWNGYWQLHVQTGLYREWVGLSELEAVLLLQGDPADAIALYRVRNPDWQEDR